MEGALQSKIFRYNIAGDRIVKNDEYNPNKKQDQKLVAIGQRVKAVRESLRLSQREMAASLNTSASYLSEIEGGKANPGPGFFLGLSDAYNVSIEYIFHGEVEMFYDSKTRLPSKEFKNVNDIDSPEKLFWLMNRSSMFRNTILGYAARFYLENEATIKKNFRKEES
ncbi:MAG: Helix-turn-helix protein [Acidobacteriota bacterium]|nr:Helix-turn-helix protein [Acidobacteriota bacterium]